MPTVATVAIKTARPGYAHCAHRTDRACRTVSPFCTAFATDDRARISNGQSGTGDTGAAHARVTPAAADATGTTIATDAADATGTTGAANPSIAAAQALPSRIGFAAVATGPTGPTCAAGAANATGTATTADAAIAAAARMAAIACDDQSATRNSDRRIRGGHTGLAGSPCAARSACTSVAASRAGRPRVTRKPGNAIRTTLAATGAGRARPTSNSNTAGATNDTCTTGRAGPPVAPGGTDRSFDNTADRTRWCALLALRGSALRESCNHDTQSSSKRQRRNRGMGALGE